MIHFTNVYCGPLYLSFSPLWMDIRTLMSDPLPQAMLVSFCMVMHHPVSVTSQVFLFPQKCHKANINVTVSARSNHCWVYNGPCSAMAACWRSLCSMRTMHSCKPLREPPSVSSVINDFTNLIWIVHKMKGRNPKHAVYSGVKHWKSVNHHLNKHM